MKDYHKILGVNKNASREEIKSAYRKAVLKYHPDRGSQSAQKFQQIQEAYEVLTGKRQGHSTADIYSPLLWHLKIKEYPLDLNAIRTKADQRVATPDEHINVTFVLTGIGKIMYIKGLHSHFDVIHGPKVRSGLFRENKEVKVKWFYSYTLQPRKKGYLTIGPCLAIVNGRKIRSSPLYIKVSEHAHQSRQQEVGMRYYSYVVLMFLVIALGSVLANHFIPKTQPESELQKAQPVNEFLRDQANQRSPAKAQLATGETPFAPYLDEKAFEKGSGNMIRFMNGPYYDAVVCLTDVESGKVVRNGYIRAGESLEMEHIEKGVYFLRLIKGKGWNPNKEVMGEGIQGGFVDEALYKEFKDSSYHFQMNQTDEQGNHQSAVYQIKLYPTSDGNMTGRDVPSGAIFGN